MIWFASITHSSTREPSRKYMISLLSSRSSLGCAGTTPNWVSRSVNYCLMVSRRPTMSRWAPTAKFLCVSCRSPITSSSRGFSGCSATHNPTSTRYRIRVLAPTPSPMHPSYTTPLYQQTISPTTTDCCPSSTTTGNVTRIISFPYWRHSYISSTTSTRRLRMSSSYLHPPTCTVGTWIGLDRTLKLTTRRARNTNLLNWVSSIVFRMDKMRSRSGRNSKKSSTNNKNSSPNIQINGIPSHPSTYSGNVWSLWLYVSIP